VRIAIAGAGYVGLANAVLLAQEHNVIIKDVDAGKVALLQQKKSPIFDPEIEDFLNYKPLNLTATTSSREAYMGAAIVLIATSTDYDVHTNAFDTTSVESVAQEIRAVNPQAVIVVKSTVPVGFTERLQKMLDFPCVLFSPEFLREGKALHDNLYPSRIVVGGKDTA
jgi:UDPglucose 6-dehydrogenase